MQPAWWQQWWFRLLLLVASAILIFTIVQWRTRQLRLQQADLRTKVPADGADLLFFMVDIDHFKEVNDRFGHAAGDAVLMQMRSRLEQVFRDTDYLVRWGGEAFLLVARWMARDHATDLA